jgi:hypothetical protein
MKRLLPSRERVMEILSYDPETGLLTWKYRANAPIEWNNRYVGTIAGRRGGKTSYISIDNGFYPTAAICWLIYSGEPVPDLIDHIDTDHFNNKPNNLRDAISISNNNANRKIHKNNTTGIKGVTRAGKKKQKFEAGIHFQGKRIYLGVFETIEEAAEVRQKKALELFGKFARHE